MGFVPPPLPPSNKEIKRRRDAGARTLKELDPALFQWAERQEAIRFIPVIFGSIILCIFFIWMVFVEILQ